MGLQEYRRKRDFRRTPEPQGGRRKRATQLSFVIQKHDATRLHYDFRLEWDGVLKSWAVPKGPSLDPAVKSLAVEVEDHPLAYADFEGIIPAGEYGGGTVLVWDQGTWQPQDDDPAAALRKGHLRFALHGKKLKGDWSLIRIRGDGERNNWLLIKKDDKYAIDGDAHGITERKANSVLTRRGLVQVAQATDREWTGNGARSRRNSATASTAVQAAARRTLTRAAKQEPAPPKSVSRKRATKRVAAGPVTVAGVELTHPERVLFPDAGITKADLARYYVDLANWILPHVVERPLSLVRCPAGGAGECFYQKHWTDSLPEQIGFVSIREKSGTDKYVQITEVSGLVALAQISVLEIHPWGARSDDVENPDRIVIDLDPGPGVDWPAVIQGARDVRSLLDELELDSFVRTSGGKGLHVVIPLSRRNTWDEVEQFAHNVADTLATHASDQYIANMRKALRHGRICVDYLRNQRGATAVACYSTRNRPGCPVATPLDWKELGRVTSADMFTIRNVPSRLSRLKRDPWDGFFQTRQSLTRRTLERVAEFAAASPDTSESDDAVASSGRTKLKAGRRSKSHPTK